MNKIIFAFLTITLITSASFAQVTIDWNTLTNVSYKTIYDQEAGYVYMKPIFGDELKELDGKEVLLKGYVLPMDTEGEQYALSAYPYSSCFFCGGANKESVVELWLQDKGDRFKLDQVVSIRGTLQLNEDHFGLNYFIKEARAAD